MNMNDFNAYISNNYNDFLQIARNIVNDYEDSRDICNELICELIELPQSKKDKIKNIKHYFIQMCKFSAYYKTSKYQYKYNRIKFVELGDNAAKSIDEEYIEQPDVVKIAETLVQSELLWYEKIVWNMKVKKNMSLKSMSEETSIPMSSLYVIYNEAKNKIKNSVTNGNIKIR